jgi:hypothetical protein
LLISHNPAPTRLPGNKEDLRRDLDYVANRPWSYAARFAWFTTPNKRQNPEFKGNSG